MSIQPRTAEIFDMCLGRREGVFMHDTYTCTADISIYLKLGVAGPSVFSSRIIQMCESRSFFDQNLTPLKFGVSWIPREWNHIPDVVYSCAVLHKPLEP